MLQIAQVDRHVVYTYAVVVKDKGASSARVEQPFPVASH